MVSQGSKYLCFGATGIYFNRMADDSMNGIISNKNTFESRLNVLRHVAGRYPCWVGRNELSQYMIGHSRTHQRALNELVDLGYLERDNCNPRGYRLIKGKFEEFQHL